MRLAALVFVVFLSGCTGLGGDARCRDQLVERLYLGGTTTTGVVIPEADFQRFVESEITPRFPAGLTIYAASGQWRGKDQAIVREPSRVVEIVHGGSSIEEAKLEEVAAAYKSRFTQEAVLRTRSLVRACL
ncbi:DUF3574 domain-containing protein [Usitatibacter palustris]|uniref:DUF3574 domain-containing protein n=1 Tax=Usitatibacter palustris TaxID=2732487 RepID=A0A6M4H9L5_9PROT|nr:DUF3574 domain-containing protein [Usitatibacter palustris]QJR14737.1 hypothetical protein DSM104440_01547 [Usitatibacter palustris]